MMRAKKITVGLSITALIVAGLFAASFLLNFHKPTDPPPIIGASFDPVYARFLGEDPVAVFHTMVADWGFRYIRISVHWDAVEPATNTFDFSTFDQLMAEANKYHAKVILAVGQKTPRWPECHIPSWVGKRTDVNYQTELHRYIATVVEHYRSNNALEMWQVENEPFLAFGVDCPAFTGSELTEELAMVKGLDPNHPTITSDSGELSSWADTGRAADYFGMTLYRSVWNSYIGYFNYDYVVPAALYRAKLALIKRDPTHAFVLELQAEPWLPGKTILDVPLSEQYQSLDLARLKKNIAFGTSLGLPRMYLWGAEWWYWLQGQGNATFASYVQNLAK